MGGGVVSTSEILPNPPVWLQNITTSYGHYVCNVSSDVIVMCLFCSRRYTLHLLTPWNRILLEKLTGLQLVKKFPAIYGTRSFITAFTSARYLSVSWAGSIQWIPPHLTSRRSILTLSSHLRLGLSSGLFHASSLPQQSYMARPSHSWFYHPHNSGWVQIMKLLIMKFSLLPVTASLFGPNILLNTLFSKFLVYVPPSVSATSFTPIQGNRQNYSPVYTNL
jgi:hypothetical protein